MPHPFSAMRNLPIPDVCDLARLESEGHLTGPESTIAGHVSTFIKAILSHQVALTPEVVGRVLAEPIAYLVARVESLSARVAELEEQAR